MSDQATQAGLGSCFAVDQMKNRLDYLAALAKTPEEQVEEVLHRETPITYSDNRHLQQTIEQALAASRGKQSIIYGWYQQSNPLIKTTDGPN